MSININRIHLKDHLVISDRASGGIKAVCADRFYNSCRNRGENILAINNEKVNLHNK